MRFLTATAFKYDARRDAYILRLVGNRWGPVLIRRSERIRQRDEGAPV